MRSGRPTCRIRSAKNVKKLVAQYEEQTGVKVNYTEFSYDMLHDKILSAAAGGNTPDVAWGLPEWTGEFHSMGILEDLSDRYANWDDASVLSDAVMKGMSIGDEIIGVPYEMTVRAYLCHENIMEKGGASVPATWDDVLSMTDFKDKTGTYPYALACTGVRAPQEMIVYLAQKGLEICSLQDDGMYKNTWKDNADQLAAAADVFQFYKDCIDSGVVDPNSKSFGYEETDDNFVNGFSASYVTGNWLQEKRGRQSGSDVRCYRRADSGTGRRHAGNLHGAEAAVPVQHQQEQRRSIRLCDLRMRQGMAAGRLLQRISAFRCNRSGQVDRGLPGSVR